MSDTPLPSGEGKGVREAAGDDTPSLSEAWVEGQWLRDNVKLFSCAKANVS